jgi:SAM-dependent methyltransferase
MAPTPDQIRASVLERFTQTAESPERERNFAIGPTSAKNLGYDTAEIDGLPASLTESFCGVGNPIGLRELEPGQVVLDLGSGAGMDSILAARRVGETGRAIGIDMTRAMIEKAQGNAGATATTNVDFRQGNLEELPVEDSSVDVVITNGVLNLCPEKPLVLAEAYRVLRPGGRLQMADVLLHADVTPEDVANKGEWSD